MNSIRLLILIISSLALFSCMGPSDLQTPPSQIDPNLYFITDGGITRTVEELASEYHTFFFLPGESRDIYLGGKLQYTANNYDAVWLVYPDWWPNNLYKSLPSSDIDPDRYYSVKMTSTNIPSPSTTTDYPISAGNGQEHGYAYGNYNLTFKVTNDAHARDWGVRVYQQQSYNELVNVKHDIVNAFADMSVDFNNGNSIIDVNLTLANHILDLDPYPTNVSWHLKQFSPYGEGSVEKPLLASLSNGNMGSKTELNVDLHLDKTTFVEGESIDILTTVSNSSGKVITIGYPDEFLYDYANDSLYSATTITRSLALGPNESYCFFINPTYNITSTKVDNIGHIIQPGEYDYYISYKISPDEYISNKLHIKVTPLPDSLKSAYTDLKIRGDVENAFLLYEMHKGSFFEQIFFSRYLKYPANFKEIIGLKANQYEEYILKYPDNSEAWYFLRNMIYKMSDNPELVERIITRLQKEKPYCKLLKVLHNQPEYINYKIHK